MQPHHTKDKGDRGVAHALADLVDQGFLVLSALTEHAPFDLVAYKDGAFLRVQVKYRTLSPHGTVEVHFRSSWSDAQGAHARPLDKSEVDVVCIYCPETNLCYYIAPRGFGGSVTLRIEPSRNGQRRKVLHAAEYRQMPRMGAMFSPTSHLFHTDA
jgi:hypothetical protein